MFTIAESYRVPGTHGTGVPVEEEHPKKSLQHSLNNPLAGLLAELQLLELEELPAEHRESVERCIGLCRRVITIVRERVPPTLE